MIAIVETATGTVEAIVESLDGVDMAGRHLIALPEGYDPIAVSHVLVDGEWQPNVDAAWARLRAERHATLRACDWTVLPDVPAPKIGRASCRESVCQYVYISGVAVSLTKTKIKIPVADQMIKHQN